MGDIEYLYWKDVSCRQTIKFFVPYCERCTYTAREVIKDTPLSSELSSELTVVSIPKIGLCLTIVAYNKPVIFVPVNKFLELYQKDMNSVTYDKMIELRLVYNDSDETMTHEQKHRLASFALGYGKYNDGTFSAVYSKEGFAEFIEISGVNSIPYKNLFWIKHLDDGDKENYILFTEIDIYFKSIGFSEKEIEQIKRESYETIRKRFV